MKPAVLIALIPLVLPSAAGAQVWIGECDHRAERAAVVPASGAGSLRLLTRAGGLEIQGRPGLAEVRLRGTACASDADLLEQIQLSAGRSGSEISAETLMPEGCGNGYAYARLDLVVEVPERMMLDVQDGSGEVEVRGVAALRLRDGSGGVDVSGVAGEVQIEDGSGEIRLRDVRGDVRLSDSSGDIDVRGVQGNVVVERDGSGEIEIAEVTRSVHVERDTSGGIRVSDVRGDLIVSRDGSGGVRHSNVAGTVSIPHSRR